MLDIADKYDAMAQRVGRREARAKAKTDKRR